MKKKAREGPTVVHRVDAEEQGGGADLDDHLATALVDALAQVELGKTQRVVQH